MGTLTDCPPWNAKPAEIGSQILRRGRSAVSTGFGLSLLLSFWPPSYLSLSPIGLTNFGTETILPLDFPMFFRCKVRHSNLCDDQNPDISWKNGGYANGERSDSKSDAGQPVAGSTPVASAFYLTPFIERGWGVSWLTKVAQFLPLSTL